MDSINNYIHTIHTFMNQGDSGYKSLFEALKRDIERHKESLKKLEKCLKIVDNLKFKPGSVVVHKTLGNGLVLCPYVKDLLEGGGSAFAYDEILDKFENDLGYVVQFVKQENSRFIFVKEIVKEEDIMPYTEASKILYGE
jgi:hypothetical protein